MDFVYRIFTCLLGLFGAAAALGINTFYSASTRFQNVVGAHPDASHGWIGLLLAILGFVGALLLLFRGSIPIGALLLIIAAIGFFFVVNWWAWLAAPAMLLAAFFALYYYFIHRRRHEGELRPGDHERGRGPWGRPRPPEEYPPEGRRPAAG